MLIEILGIKKSLTESEVSQELWKSLSHGRFPELSEVEEPWYQYYKKRVTGRWDAEQAKGKISIFLLNSYSLWT